MPKAIRAYVKVVDSISHYSGLVAMYLIFALLGLLLYSSIMKVFFLPINWGVELGQFVMVAYYLLGGAWSLKQEEHVRMDLLYGGWTVKKKARVNLVTDCAMIFFLCLLLYGAINSTIYAFDTGERSFSAWRPYVAPVKVVMAIGIALALLQAIAILIKDWATIKGKALS
ncbi:MAG: TRAP transporter small permease subunit [Zavarzinia sp.]|nr:TRAP transporter small permease subunit [Zavarzinia sp.]